MTREQTRHVGHPNSSPHLASRPPARTLCRSVHAKGAVLRLLRNEAATRPNQSSAAPPHRIHRRCSGAGARHAVPLLSTQEKSMTNASRPLPRVPAESQKMEIATPVAALELVPHRRKSSPAFAPKPQRVPHPRLSPLEVITAVVYCHRALPSRHNSDEFQSATRPFLKSKRRFRLNRLSQKWGQAQMLTKLRHG